MYSCCRLVCHNVCHNVCHSVCHKLGAIIFCLSSAVAAQGEMILQNYDPAKHDRFANNSSFIGSGFNWSGVGRTSNGAWGTLISPSFMLTATHAPAAVNGTVRFFPTNDSSSFVERTIVENITLTQLGSNLPSDLTLTRLNTPISAGIESYPIVELPIAAAYENLTIFTFGLSNRADPFTNVRLGRNQIDAVLPLFSDNALGQTKNDAYIFDFDNPGGVGADETFLQGGDSGGPSFVNAHSRPALVGIHWFIYTTNELGSPNPGSGDSLVSSFADELNAAMALTGSSERVTVLTSVPEPSAAILLGMGLTLGYLRKRLWRCSDNRIA